jgi:hypothetical protein
MLGTTKAQTRLHCVDPSSVDPSRANYSIASPTPKLQNGIAIDGIYSCCDLQN